MEYCVHGEIAAICLRCKIDLLTAENISLKTNLNELNKAVLSERERCAGIAKDMLVNTAGNAIAAAIMEAE